MRRTQSEYADKRNQDMQNTRIRSFVLRVNQHVRRTTAPCLCGVFVVVWWCFCTSVFCGGVLVVVCLWWRSCADLFLLVFSCRSFCGGVLVVVWSCLCGGVLVPVFLWWCGDVFLCWCGGVFVVVFLWWCSCGGVCVVVLV